MAGEVTLKVDASLAIKKFSPEGVPDAVRRNLRAMLPQTVRKVAASVDTKLNTDLKSRRRLEVQQQIVENPKEIYGRVRVIATADPRMLPTWLEEGTKAHEIVATNASALAFFWEKVGKDVFFKSVHHPGFAGIQYMQRTLAEMRDEITSDLTTAVRDGARKA